ncbi:MAG TPA: hypothetical protein VGL19_08290 [Polyangiaceae bacterium]
MSEVTRVLRLLVLFAAFFVVAVRCFGSYSALASAAEPSSRVSKSQARPSPSAPIDQDAPCTAELDDDSDDSADALLAPAPVRLSALIDDAPAGLDRGVWAAQGPLPSHASSLERPPRA